MPSTFFLPCLKSPTISISNNSFFLLNETTPLSFSNLSINNKKHINMNNSLNINYLLQSNLTKTTNKLSFIKNVNFNNKTFNRLKKNLNFNEIISTTLLPIINKNLTFNNANESINKILNNNNLINESSVFVLRAHQNDCMKLRMAFWSNGMVFKVVPCLLLTISIVALLNIISDVRNKRKNLAKV